MSTRENIAENIITVLSAVSSPITLKKVTREPFDVDELSEQQYPAVFVQSGNEARSDETMTSSSVTRQGIADFVIVGFVKGTDTNIDTKRNQLISTIETALESDRTRGGFAKITQVVEVSTDEGTLFPIGGIRVVVRVYVHLHCWYTLTINNGEQNGNSHRIRRNDQSWLRHCRRTKIIFFRNYC